MGRGRRDKVYLRLEQKENLEKISRNGHGPAKKILHARILLMCDEGEQATRKWTDEEIGEALQVHRNTVLRIRQRFLQQGEQPALNRQPRKTPPTPVKVDGATEAQIIALCCSDPPSGRADWTIRLLTSELKKRQIVTKISCTTVWRTLKKTNYALGKPNDSVFRNGI
jgi:transposase